MNNFAIGYTIVKAKQIPGSITIAHNVSVAGKPFGVVVQHGRTSVWLCKPLIGEASKHWKLRDAKVAMMDLILIEMERIKSLHAA